MIGCLWRGAIAGFHYPLSLDMIFFKRCFSLWGRGRSVRGASPHSQTHAQCYHDALCSRYDEQWRTYRPKNKDISDRRLSTNRQYYYHSRSNSLISIAIYCSSISVYWSFFIFIVETSTNMNRIALLRLWKIVLDAITVHLHYLLRSWLFLEIAQVILYSLFGVADRCTVLLV